MSKDLDRFALGCVNVDGGDIVVEPYSKEVDLSIAEYSRFKYGDGRVSYYYGSAIARQIIDQCAEIAEDGALFVTSSAYKVARPAAASLLGPFVEMAREIAPPNLTVVPFKINRSKLTNGDYATMSLEDRTAVMKENGLRLPEDLDLAGKPVVALDDIRVTGSHEISVDNVLREAGVSWIGHSYILQVADSKTDPTLEAALNHAAIKDIDDIIALAEDETFLPNARLAKRILSEDPKNIQRFCSAVPPNVARGVLSDVIGDELYAMPKYQPGFNAMISSMLISVE